MRNSVVAVLFAVMVLGVSAQVEQENGYAIDTAAGLLDDLLQDAQTNLRELESNWATKLPILNENISNLQDQISNKDAECDGLDGVLADRQTQLTNAVNFAAWLQKRINDNNDLIASLLEKRCTGNNNYIEALKNDKVALKLVDFLRTQIANKDSFDFAQRKVFMRKLSSFLQVFKRGNYSELVELEKQLVDSSQYDVDVDESVQGRTSDEIGTGHIDNDKGDLELEGFQDGQRLGWIQIKAQLLELLNNLEDTINAKVTQAQEDEVNSNVTAADYKLKLEFENKVYAKDLVSVNKQIVQLTAAVAQDEENVSNCRSQEADLKGQLSAAQTDLQHETDAFNKKDADLKEEIEIFNEVIALFTPAEEDQDASYKERVDDYLDNGTFDDDSSYDPREVPEIDLLNNQNDQESQ